MDVPSDHKKLKNKQMKYIYDFNKPCAANQVMALLFNYYIFI